MAECKECGNEYKIGVREFCSNNCFKKDIQKRINEATANEKSHTSNFAEDKS